MSTVNPLPLSTLAPFAAQPAAGAPARTEIAFVLNNVADWQALAAGVRPGVQVVVLDGHGRRPGANGGLLWPKKPPAVWMRFTCWGTAAAAA
jgi:hypothetical protein